MADEVPGQRVAQFAVRARQAAGPVLSNVTVSLGASRHARDGARHGATVA